MMQAKILAGTWCSECHSFQAKRCNQKQTQRYPKDVQGNRVGTKERISRWLGCIVGSNSRSEKHWLEEPICMGLRMGSYWRHGRKSCKRSKIALWPRYDYDLLAPKKGFFQTPDAFPVSNKWVSEKSPNHTPSVSSHGSRVSTAEADLEAIGSDMFAVEVDVSNDGIRDSIQGFRDEK